MTILTRLNDDERTFLNAACQGTPISKLTRQSVLQSINFAKDMSEDSVCVDMLEHLADAISGLTDAEWDTLKYHLPFLVSVDAETNIDVVPEDTPEQ